MKKDRKGTKKNKSWIVYVEIRARVKTFTQVFRMHAHIYFISL